MKPSVVDLIVYTLAEFYTPAEFAAGAARGFGVFDALSRDGVDIL